MKHSLRFGGLVVLIALVLSACGGGAAPAADQMLVLLGRLPGADGARRQAAKAAAERLRALGIGTIGGASLTPPEGAAAPVQVRVLGRFEVVVAGRPVPLPAWRSRQARSLFKILVARRGRPVSRTLSSFVDSLITWRVSPTTALLGYRVTVNGTRVCTVRTVTGATTQSCRVRAAIGTGDAVRVTAVGIDGTLSTSIGASVTPASATNRLLAVIYFPTGEFTLDDTARQILATVSRQARGFGFDTALMVGHTDSDGTSAANATLSRRRAAQVAEYFHRVYPALRADHAGRGETDPARPNAGDRDKAANRRVEIYVG